MQHEGTFHCLVCGQLRGCDLRLFNHSERLGFSFVRLSVRLSDGGTFILVVATTKSKTID